jgi:hypothetical protein
MILIRLFYGREMRDIRIPPVLRLGLRIGLRIGLRMGVRNTDTIHGSMVCLSHCN